jgi:ABC-type multidrug transport system fused ATPase/permease subunit
MARWQASINAVLRKAAFDDISIFTKNVGESGSKISGGQRQRIAIARALLKNAPLIILDEPTASLDTESESRVLETLIDLKEQGKGVLIITHRASTMKIADRFMLIKDQSIIGNLTFEEASSALHSRSF